MEIEFVETFRKFFLNHAQSYVWIKAKSSAPVTLRRDDSNVWTLVAEFASDLGVDYPILLGKEGVGDSYGDVKVLPVTVYVGRDGKIVEKVFGVKGHDEIEDDVRKALTQKR